MYLHSTPDCLTPAVTYSTLPYYLFNPFRTPYTIFLISSITSYLVLLLSRSPMSCPPPFFTSLYPYWAYLASNVLLRFFSASSNFPFYPPPSIVSTYTYVAPSSMFTFPYIGYPSFLQIRPEGNIVETLSLR